MLLISRLGFAQSEPETHHIDFNDVPAIEFIRFVSKICQSNFILITGNLDLISPSSGKPMSSEEVVEALVQMLRMHGFAVSAEGNYYVVHRYSEEELKNGAHIRRADMKHDNLVAGDIPSMPHDNLEFATLNCATIKGKRLSLP